MMNVTENDNLTDDYNDSLSIIINCTINDNNIDIIIQTLFLTNPCGLSFLCLMSLMVYTINKPLFNINSWKKFIIHLIVLGAK